MHSQKPEGQNACYQYHYIHFTQFRSKYTQNIIKPNKHRPRTLNSVRHNDDDDDAVAILSTDVDSYENNELPRKAQPNPISKFRNPNRH